MKKDEEIDVYVYRNESCDCDCELGEYSYFLVHNSEKAQIYPVNLTISKEDYNEYLKLLELEKKWNKKLQELYNEQFSN